jgi:hypothetical protein
MDVTTNIVSKRIVTYIRLQHPKSTFSYLKMQVISQQEPKCSEVQMNTEDNMTRQ